MRNELILQKLIGYAEKIIAYCEGYSYGSFIKDTKLVEACVFNLSQMGELCKSADDDFVKAHPQIPWNEMYGLRNRIVHDYEGVNLTLVWKSLRTIYLACALPSVPSYEFRKRRLRCVAVPF